MVFFGELLFYFLRPWFVFRNLVSGVTTVAVSRPVTIPLLGPLPVAIPISTSVTITVSTTITFTSPFTLPFSSSLTASFPLAFALFTSFLSLLFSTLVLLPLLLFPCFPGCFLFFPFLHLFLLPNLALEPSFLLLDLAQFFANALPFRAASCSFGSVLLVRLRTAESLLLGCLLANLGTTQLAKARLDGVAVNQFLNDVPSFLIDIAAVDGAINKGGGFTAIDSQQLHRVTLNLLFCNLQNRLQDLGFIILRS